MVSKLTNRWIMCKSCGVKLLEEESDGTVIISKCPICKQLYLTVENNTRLLSELRILAKKTNSTVEETLRRVIAAGIKTAKDAEDIGECLSI